MDFWQYRTIYQSLKATYPNINPDQQYRESMDACLASGSVASAHQVESEYVWAKNKKPYYSVYPSIIPMLTRLNLDIDSGLVKIPMDVLCIRFPKSHNPLIFTFEDQRYEMRAIMMSRTFVKDSLGMTLWMDYGETMTLPNPEGKPYEFPVMTYRNFRCRTGQTIEQDLIELPTEPSSDTGVQIPLETQKDVVRLCCSLCLMQHDPEIISPDVLNADQEKYEKTKDQKFIEKSHRRGKVGWIVGAKLEVIPHVRRPHPAIVWTGKGRTVPKVVFRKGSIVHRKAVEKLPSGFEKLEEPTQ